MFQDMYLHNFLCKLQFGNLKVFVNVYSDVDEGEGQHFFKIIVCSVYLEGMSSAKKKGF